MMGPPLTYAIIAALAVIVAALAGLVLVMRSRQASAGANVSGDPAAAPPRDETLIFRPQRPTDARSPARLPPSAGAFSASDDGAAYLVPLIDEAGTPGEPIAILAKSVYIGRDSQRAQVVFADPTVSRLHARLVLESDGVFTLHDEGSTSGTFVNAEQVDLQPRRLRSGDVIDFGRQRAIFQAADAGLDVFAGLDPD